MEYTTLHIYHRWFVQIRFGLQIVFVCLYITPSHNHHCAKLIWRHWTYKMPVRYNLSSVWVRLSIFSRLSIIQYVGLCFQFIHFLRDDLENIYTLSYYNHQIGSMNYYLLFRFRPWNNGMRCMYFYILIQSIRCMHIYKYLYITSFTAIETP